MSARVTEFQTFSADIPQDTVPLVFQHPPSPILPPAVAALDPLRHFNAGLFSLTIDAPENEIVLLHEVWLYDNYARVRVLSGNSVPEHDDPLRSLLIDVRTSLEEEGLRVYRLKERLWKQLELGQEFARGYAKSGVKVVDTGMAQSSPNITYSN